MNTMKKGSERRKFDFEGVRQVLREAQSRRFLEGDDERIEMLAATFDQSGYLGVMRFYIEVTMCTAWSMPPARLRLQSERTPLPE
jgi:hypothetical protein